MKRKISPLTVAVFTGTLGFSASPVLSNPEYTQDREQQVGAQPNQMNENATGSDMAGFEMNAEDVKQAQQALKEQGHDPGAIDGVLGPRTEAAVRSFQESSGLQPTGQLDHKTIVLLEIELQPSEQASQGESSGSQERSIDAPESSSSS